MNILLLGGSGMVGRNIREHPKFSRYNFFYPSRSKLNIKSREELKNYMENHQIDTVINGAGRVGGIQENINHPFDFLHENLAIGMNLACAVRELEIPRVLNLGSSCMYPKDIEGAISEDRILTGKLEQTNEGYALSKIATLKYFEYLSRECSHTYKTLMPCNLYGRYDHFDGEKSHLIASIIVKMAQAKDGDPIEIWGDGTARREFMDACDFADAVFFSLENYDRLPDILNVGTGIDYTVKEYYEVAAQVIGRQCQFVFDRERPVGMARKLLNVEKIQYLGWNSKVSLTEGIERAYVHYKEVCS